MRLLTASVLLVGVLAACGDDDDGTSGAPDLAGTTWELTAVDGDDVAVPGVSWIGFTDDGSVTGSGGCNNFMGGYEQDGGSLTIGPIAATLRLCAEPALDEQERMFFAALEATTGASAADDVLTLDGDDGALATLVPSEQPDGVAGSWNVLGYNNGQEAVVSLVLGTELTAEFSDDGMVSGSAGCNDYTGEYSVDGDTVSIATLAQTSRACIEPDGVMDQELQYLQALQSAATWSIRDGVLTFRTADDAIAVTMGQ